MIQVLWGIGVSCGVRAPREFGDDRCITRNWQQGVVSLWGFPLLGPLRTRYHHGVRLGVHCPLLQRWLAAGLTGCALWKGVLLFTRLLWTVRGRSCSRLPNHSRVSGKWWEPHCCFCLPLIFFIGVPCNLGLQGWVDGALACPHEPSAMKLSRVTRGGPPFGFESQDTCLGSLRGWLPRM
jgi:hypothetical protein